MAQVVIPGFRKIETSSEGTGDYNNLSNIPFINNVPVKGNLKTEGRLLKRDYKSGKQI